ncbi:MAG: hypothetical protein KDA88_05060 [Planctomycetaceae bacterium]|nr:hypothetical protein [Planctomycetaceae bacterium]
MFIKHSKRPECHLRTLGGNASSSRVVRQLQVDCGSRKEADTTTPNRPSTLRFLELFSKRAIESTVPRELIDHGCLLCSEHLPKNCHRRVAVDYLSKHWGGIEIVHLF